MVCLSRLRGSPGAMARATIKTPRGLRKSTSIMDEHHYFTIDNPKRNIAIGRHNSFVVKLSEFLRFPMTIGAFFVLHACGSSLNWAIESFGWNGSLPVAAGKGIKRSFSVTIIFVR